MGSDKKIVKFVGFALFLMIITILPQYEVVKDRHYKNVNLDEAENTYQLKKGDSIEQIVLVDNEDRLEKLLLYISSTPWLENKGTVHVTLSNDTVKAESFLNTASIVSSGGGLDCLGY